MSAARAVRTAPRKMSGQAPTINPLEGHLNNFRTLQKEIGKLQSSSSEQGTRILENEMVLKELELLEEEAQVFKLIGPVLVKQELVEVKNNVSKRIEFIKNDISRLGDNLNRFRREKMLQQRVIAIATTVFVATNQGRRIRETCHQFSYQLERNV